MSANGIDPTPASHSWTIDTTQPDVQITDPVSNPLDTNQTWMSFSFSSTDPLATFMCYVYPVFTDWTPCSSPQEYSSLPDGDIIFRVYAVDPVGHWSVGSADRSWIIDALPPETVIASSPPALTNQTTADFTFTDSNRAPGVSSSYTNFYCSLDGGSETLCPSFGSGVLPYSGLADGLHTLSARGRDNAGNVEVSPAIYQWTVDTTPPNTILSSYPPASTTQTTASFTFSSNDAAAQLLCALDGAAFAVCVSPKNFSGLANGVHQFVVKAVDLVGNEDPTPAVYSWAINSPPTVVSTTPASGSTAGEVKDPIVVTFSQAMDCATISGTTFQLSQGGSPVAGSVSCSGVTAQFDPASPLDHQATYAAALSGSIRDVAGLSLQPYSWSFVTRAPRWSNPAKIGVSSASYDTLTTAVNSSGQAIAVWTYDSNGNGFMDIWANRFDPATGWGTPGLLAQDPVNCCGSVQPTKIPVAMDENGNALIAWPVKYQNSVWANLWPAGQNWNYLSSFVVSSNCTNPSVAMNGSGNAVVVCKYSNYIVQRKYSALNRSWDSGLIISSTQVPADLQGVANAVTMDNAGVITVVYKLQFGSTQYTTLGYSRFTPGSGWVYYILYTTPTAFTPYGFGSDPTGLSVDLKSSPTGQIALFFSERVSLTGPGAVNKVMRGSPTSGWSSAETISSGSYVVSGDSVKVNDRGDVFSFWKDAAANFTGKFNASSGSWENPVSMSLPIFQIGAKSLGDAIAINKNWPGYTPIAPQIQNYSAATGTWSAPQSMNLGGTGVDEMRIEISAGSAADTMIVWRDGTAVWSTYLE